MTDRQTFPMHRYEQPDFSETVRVLNIKNLQHMVQWQTVKGDAADTERESAAQHIETATLAITALVQQMTTERLIQLLDAMQERNIRSPLIDATRTALEHACNGSVERVEADARKAIVYLYLQLRLNGFHKWFESVLAKT